MIPSIDRVTITHRCPSVLDRRVPQPAISARPNRKEPMTILLGIMCPSGIIYAADSMMTHQDGSKSFEDKISVIQCSENMVFIAQAGCGLFTHRIAVKMARNGKGLKISKAQNVIGLAEGSMREFKNDLKDDDQKAILQNEGAILMVGFYANKIFQIFTIDAQSVMAMPARSHSVSAGHGLTLANYLLSEVATEQSDLETALATAIYVVKKVKDYNSTCGGDTTVKYLRMETGPHTNNVPVAYARTIPANSVRSLESKINAVDARTQENTNGELLFAFRMTTI
jgi:20S proteasome alpha/beta subunit